MSVEVKVRSVVRLVELEGPAVLKGETTMLAEAKDELAAERVDGEG